MQKLLAKLYQFIITAMVVVFSGLCNKSFLWHNVDDMEDDGVYLEIEGGRVRYSKEQVKLRIQALEADLLKFRAYLEELEKQENE